MITAAWLALAVVVLAVMVADARSLIADSDLHTGDEHRDRR